jgi:hypothetical protein
VFSILVLIGHPTYITQFIERDQLQQDQLDHKLPFDLEKLTKMMKKVHADLFHERQWEFTAPVLEPFVLRRYLADDIILPFIGQPKSIGRGGFGDVYQVYIDPDHQRFGSQGQEASSIILKYD